MERPLGPTLVDRSSPDHQLVDRLRVEHESLRNLTYGQQDGGGFRHGLSPLRRQLTTTVHVVGHEAHEVVVAVDDDRLAVGSVVGRFSGPDGLAGGTVTIEAGAGGRDPVAKTFADISEVAVPAGRRRRPPSPPHLGWGIRWR